ncbi:MAG TPA: type I-C CRISPR-associated protein Cas8c/Csd1, partial [Oscillospiraceae bacterium]|nr:type I-C CRISPR-associated protein Cas8c/Csd1 [Oscillospiraceae bacterium]
MGWMQRCLETYDNNAHMVGKIVADKEPLAPMFFITQKAQIEVTLTEDGQFYGARLILKDEERTLIPATEDSEGRAGKTIFPHPLCDELRYIALGNETYPDHENYRDKYEAYLKELASWVESKQSHYIVRAVYRYCLGGTMIADLTAAGIVQCGEDGRLKEGKIGSDSFEQCLARWRVLKAGYTGGESWTDKTLFDSYRDFRIEQAEHEEKAVCYVSGIPLSTAKKHPKGTVRNSYGAKLLSSNDEINFTYRGRFATAEEAYSVGLVTTQKVHAALRWMVENQGTNYGGRTFICFNPKGKEVPKPEPGGMNDGMEDDPETAPLTMPEYRDRMRKALAGYRANLGDNEDIVLI